MFGLQVRFTDSRRRSIVDRIEASGQTWFYGNQPIHVQFFRYQYKPQVEAFNPLTPRFGPAGREEESLIISKGIVEVEELDNLGHIYSDHNGYIFLDARLSYVGAYPLGDERS